MDKEDLKTLKKLTPFILAALICVGLLIVVIKQLPPAKEKDDGFPDDIRKIEEVQEDLNED